MNLRKNRKKKADWYQIPISLVANCGILVKKKTVWEKNVSGSSIMYGFINTHNQLSIDYIYKKSILNNKLK